MAKKKQAEAANNAVEPVFLPNPWFVTRLLGEMRVVYDVKRVVFGDEDGTPERTYYSVQDKSWPSNSRLVNGRDITQDKAEALRRYQEKYTKKLRSLERQVAKAAKDATRAPVFVDPAAEAAGK